MKKFSCILLLLACVFSIVSCSAEHNDTNNTNEYNGSVFIEKEFFKDSDISKEGVEMTKEVVFEDRLYQLTYDTSWYQTETGVVIDTYDMQDGIVGGARIYIYRETGEVYGYFDPLAESSGPDVEKDDLKKRFEELATKYIDVEQYQYSEHEYSITDDVMVYRFKYEKYIDGFKTGDAFIVEFTSKGDLRLFKTSCLGFYDNRDIKIDKEKLEEAVENKLSELTYIKNDKYTTGKQYYHVLITLQTGELAVRTMVDVHNKDDHRPFTVTTIIPKE